jgi:hypothetical protein
MHPNTKPTVVVLILCMIILGILMLPLPFNAYKVLKFFLSLGLLYSAGFFLRPCKNLSFQPSAGQLESGTRNPFNGVFSGTLEDSRTGQHITVLNVDNSQIMTFLGDGNSIYRKSLPPISLQMSLGLVVTAMLMNPLANIHLPRTAWISLDVIVLGLLGYAWHLIREENAGNRPHVSLTIGVGQAPDFPFMSFQNVISHISRFWPIILGGAFILSLLGTQIGDGEFEDINLGDVMIKTIGALVYSAALAVLIFLFTASQTNGGRTAKVQTNQVPGQFLIIVFLLILLSFVFSGFFTPEPAVDLDSYPEDYVPDESSYDY